DGEIGDAQPRVDAIGSDDRASRTDVEAARAGAAPLAGVRRVRVDRAVDQQLAEEEPRAEGFREEPAVLAGPAETGALGPAALEDGAGVGIPESARSGLARLDETGERA